MVQRLFNPCLRESDGSPKIHIHIAQVGLEVKTGEMACYTL